MMSDPSGVRLQKYVADCGLMSRRAAEEKILDGSIRVNGEQVEVGRKIDPGTDEVTYLGKPVSEPKFRKYYYIMLNKPRGYVTTMKDEQGRKCVAELVSDVGARVFPCGRLDIDSEGLLIMTNDGMLANRLTHPSHHIPKYYTVSVRGKIAERQLKKLNSAMEIDGTPIRPAEVEILSMTDDSTSLGFTLYEGKNRQIRKMCEKVGITVTRLKRVAVGQIELGTLKSGKWRHLTRAQVDYLRNYK